MLKTTRLPNRPAFYKNNSSKPASSQNNSSRQASRKNDDNSEIIEFGGNGIEYVKKSRKLKDQNSAKSQKLSKSGKSKGKKSEKLSKSKNSSNFNVTEVGSNFLTFGAREFFNCLWLAFTKASIL